MTLVLTQNVPTSCNKNFEPCSQKPAKCLHNGKCHIGSYQFAPSLNIDFDATKTYFCWIGFSALDESRSFVQCSLVLIFPKVPLWPCVSSNLNLQDGKLSEWVAFP